MISYGAVLERLMLSVKPSSGEAAISMIQERRLQLQSIATILHVSLKSTNLKTMAHYSGIMERLIQIKKPCISWKPSSKYDSGKDPQIAVDASGSIVVENHKSENEDTLWYHVGKFDGSTIHWGQSHKYDNGISPSIAISTSGLVVIECHQSQNDETLWYHVGRVDGDNITWGSSHKYDSGTSPSIAINDNSMIVEVHEAGSSALAYRVGTAQQ